MRRVLGYVAVMLGVFLVALAPLMKFYVEPRVEKAQIDIYNRSVSLGSGQYFIVTQARLSEPTELQNVTITKADPERSDATNFVADQFSRTVDLSTGGDVTIGISTYVMDRHTGLAVNCCGQDPSPKEGHLLKFPFGVQQDEAYDFWDDTAGRAFPTRFTGTEEVAGITTYRFVSEVPETLISTETVPGFILGHEEASLEVERFYTAETTLWVEPITGAIIKGSQTARQWFVDPITPGRDVVLQDTSFTNTDESVQATADRVSDDVGKLKLVTLWIPVVGGIAGIILAVAGLWALVREPAERSEPRTEPASAV